MTDYRERLVRRAARTAARQTSLLTRVNDAFSESAAAQARSESLGDIAMRLDALKQAQSVYLQEQARPIVERLPTIIQQTHDELGGRR
jgi:hypothetical protein|tara:strand:+ start:3774 stop:4037 length:264 start_codon:yes stop_codon:yes gene_type:complete